MATVKKAKNPVKKTTKPVKVDQLVIVGNSSIDESIALMMHRITNFDVVTSNIDAKAKNVIIIPDTPESLASVLVERPNRAIFCLSNPSKNTYVDDHIHVLRGDMREIHTRLEDILTKCLFKVAS